MNINLVFAIALCNMTALRGSKIVIALLAIASGASPFTIGVLIAMYAVLPVVFALYAGKLSDRLGTRLPMLIGSFGVMCGLALPGLMPTLPALTASYSRSAASSGRLRPVSRSIISGMHAPT